MTVGTAADRGKPFTIYVFATNDQINGLLGSILTGPPKSFYYLSSLPQQVIEKSENVVRNGADTAAC